MKVAGRGGSGRNKNGRGPAAELAVTQPSRRAEVRKVGAKEGHVRRGRELSNCVQDGEGGAHRGITYLDGGGSGTLSPAKKCAINDLTFKGPRRGADEESRRSKNADTDWE